MRFLIYANAPMCGTGYGVQCAHLARQLKKHGHDVAVACTFGHQAGVINWDSGHGPVRLYPSGWIDNSIDVLGQHAMHFFEGDPDAGWIITITDVWVLLPVDLEPFKIIAWLPVDHWPVPPDVLQFFHKTGARSVAMSKFGQTAMIEAGWPSDHAPLMVDTNKFKRTVATQLSPGELVANREYLNIPEQAGYVVAMVAMNKDMMDRKNFNGAFRAFGMFWKQHQDAVLYVHADKHGIAGSRINLEELARHSAIPPHAIVFSNTYAMQIGFSPEMMAAIYSAADVLIAPSKGEGFCVPLIEAQACGTPVIVSDFTSQSELVGVGWKVSGQLEFDAKQTASYITPNTNEIYDALMAAWDARNDEGAREKAREFAAYYDVDTAFERDWLPILADLQPYVPAADKPKMKVVDVIVPFCRKTNEKRLRESFNATNDGSARLVIVEQGKKPDRTYAQNVNAGVKDSEADWVCLVGDDVEFQPGWIEAARQLSDQYDVIGTNDSLPGRVRNPLVANGSHADHFLIRRSYIDEEGASLDGPGVTASEAYGHWYVDREIVELAKARGVFKPCLESVVVHHHPGYDGDEKARETDPTYAQAVDLSADDHKTWMKRAPIIAGHRVR